MSRFPKRASLSRLCGENSTLPSFQTGSKACTDTLRTTSPGLAIWIYPTAVARLRRMKVYATRLSPTVTAVSTGSGTGVMDIDETDSN